MSQSKPSGLSAALGHEQFDLETCRRAHVESLTAERLGPNGVGNIYDVMHKNTLLYLRIEALSYIFHPNEEMSAANLTGYSSSGFNERCLVERE